jgi:hypothetical protein
VKRTNTDPLGWKSIPRDKSMSDCCQKVLSTFVEAFSDCTETLEIVIPSKFNLKNRLDEIGGAYTT